MNTQQIIEHLEVVSSATFSNKTMGDLDVSIQEITEAELKKLVSRATRIFDGKTIFTRKRVVDKEWNVEEVAPPTKPAKEKRAKRAKRAKDLDIPEDFMLDSLEDELEKVFKREKRANRAARRQRKARATKAPEHKAVPAPRATKRDSQRQFVMQLIIDGLSNKEIYERMLAHFGPEVITEKHKTHPAWYRSRMRRDGLI